MDILRKVLYTLTYPVWYVLSLLVGSKERPPAIANSSEEKYPLPPIEKYSPDESESIKPNDDEIVKAFGEDLAPAHFIDDEDEEDEEEEEEDEDEALEDEDEVEILDKNERADDPLPDSVKKATDSLQREIEETMKLRDELIAAADRNLQQVEALSGNARTQKSDDEATGKPKYLIGNLAQGAQAAAETLKEKAATAANTAQERIDQAADRGKEIVNQIAKKTIDSGENLAQSVREELEEAEKLVKPGDNRQKSDRETLERLKAVEQAMKDDFDGVSRDGWKS